MTLGIFQVYLNSFENILEDHTARIPKFIRSFTGLDFAIYRNGYIYHTKYDSPDLVPMSTFQNSGDNILNLIRVIADSPKLSAPAVSRNFNDFFFKENL